MKYEEIDKVLYELSDKAVRFNTEVTPMMEEITKTLDSTHGGVSKDDWEAKRDTIDAYVEGMNMMMDGLLKYVHRKVGKDD